MNYLRKLITNFSELKDPVTFFDSIKSMRYR